MSYHVKVETLTPRILAAVRKRVAIKDISTAFKPALDSVWAFLRNHRGLRTDGHNVFLYHHESPEVMPIDFGVEVVRHFDGEGDVACVTTPAGEAASLFITGHIRSLVTRTRRCTNGAPRMAGLSEQTALKFTVTGPTTLKSWRQRFSTF